MTEFGFIDHIKELFAALPDNGFEGIGDDCAVLPVGEGESLVFTTDMLAEGVHFLRPATSPRELGRKSLAVNLSDVASMGARPVATLLSLSLPADTAGTWAEEFMLGYRELSEAFGVTLAGGDTTRSAAGITINVTAIGRIADAHIKRRSGARPGDAILVAGELGLSGAGLHDILAGRYDTPAAAAHRNPLPQVAEGIWLGARSEVHAMMDLSDGLASDIRHIMELRHAAPPRRPHHGQRQIGVARKRPAPGPGLARVHALLTGCWQRPPPRIYRAGGKRPHPGRHGCNTKKRQPAGSPSSHTDRKNHSLMMYTCSSLRCM